MTGDDGLEGKIISHARKVAVETRQEWLDAICSGDYKKGVVLSPQDVRKDLEILLERALDEVRSGVDATSTISHALATHQVMCGELAAEEIAAVEPLCICPPDLLEREGFRGGCPVHDTARRLTEERGSHGEESGNGSDR